MGCGASTLEPNQEGRFRPVFRRRIEEFMARRNAGLSKKQLLQGDDGAIVSHETEVEDENHIIKKHEEDNNLVFHDTQDSPPIPQVISPTSKDKIKEVDNDSTNVVVVNDNDNNNDNDNDVENKVEEEEKKGLHDDIEVFKEPLLLHEEEEECCLDDHDEDVEKLEQLSSLGSPSFRFYCVNTHSLDEELEEIAEHIHSDDCTKDDEKKCSFQESSSSNEVPDDKEVVSKKHKRRRFRRIPMPKGGKRVLHNMHSFYHFPCSCSPQNSHLMQQQTTA